MSKEEISLILRCVIEKIEYVEMRSRNDLSLELRSVVEMLKGVHDGIASERGNGK